MSDTKLDSNIVDVPKKVELADHYQVLKVKWEQDKVREAAFIKTITDRLKAINSDVSKARTAYRDSVYLNLTTLYCCYTDIEDSEFKDDFYANLRGYLHSENIRLQANSTEVGLAIRYVFGDIKPKTIVDYGIVLTTARELGIGIADFYEWIKKRTISGTVKERNQNVQVKDSLKDKMFRARLVILRMLDYKEQTNLTMYQKPALLAEKDVHSQYGSHIVILIARALRGFDRQSHIANYNLVFAIPPSIELEQLIIDRLAKDIVGEIDYWEKELDARDESEWANELYEHVEEAESKRAAKDRDKWLAANKAVRLQSNRLQRLT